jgi:hypothetical protein
MAADRFLKRAIVRYHGAMALRRDTARALRRAYFDERAFVDAVASEIATGRLKPKDGEKLIILRYQYPERVEQQIEWALRDEGGL